MNDDEKEKDVQEALKGGDEELIKLVQRRFRYMQEADDNNRELAMDDLKFTNESGYQWDDNMKQERGSRPCYEFNKLRITAKRIINDIRANRPAGKIRAVEQGDKKTADIYEGLCRNIWNVSSGDNAVDYAAEFQVPCGMGAWRINTKYTSDTAFEQDICIEPILNPFCLYADPGCLDLMHRDAMDWVLTEKIPFKAYEKKYPDAERIDFEAIAEFDQDDDWTDEESVRIAEYWYKEPVEKEIWQMQDGKVVDSTTDEAAAMMQDPEAMAAIKNRRTIQTHDIMSVICSGSEILEGPTKWGGTMFPFIMIYGEFVVIDGSKKWWGITRFAKDAQRSYNLSRTAISESIAMAPQAKFWATAEQSEGLTKQWSEAHKKNYPFLLYNSDAKAPGPPVRMGGADIPIALIQESQIASEEIKAVTGIYDSSLGQQSNETSGRAIYARQQQGEIATFNFQDNISNGVKRTYELLIDLIPNVYDTERELRVLGSDGAEDYMVVNQVVFDPSTGETLRVNDLATGKYDVTVTVGPNFATQRQEAAETYGELGRQFPELMQIAGDLVFKSMDLPYAEDIAERLRTILPPQIQQMMDSDKEIPPEVAEMMQQAEQAMAQVQEHGQLVQAAAQELEQEKALSAVDKAEIQKEVANLKVAEANFRADVADKMADIVKASADLRVQEAGLTEKSVDLKQTALDQGREQIEPMIDAAKALSTATGIDEVLSQFMQAVDSSMGVMDQKAQELEVRTTRKPVGGEITRDGGKLTANVQFDDGTTKSVATRRNQGRLEIVPQEEERADG